MWSKNNNIKRRVMQVVSERLEQAQKSFEETCQKIEEKFEEDYEELFNKKEEAKEIEAENHVTSIIGKIL